VAAAARAAAGPAAVGPGPGADVRRPALQAGALALHALRRACGDAAFFDLLRSWSAVHRHGGVSTAGFLEHVGASGAAVLRPWLEERALPPLRR
jgi:hypothetical protein